MSVILALQIFILHLLPGVRPLWLKVKKTDAFKKYRRNGSWRFAGIFVENGMETAGRLSAEYPNGVRENAKCYENDNILELCDSIDPAVKYRWMKFQYIPQKNKGVLTGCEARFLFFAGKNGELTLLFSSVDDWIGH